MSYDIKIQEITDLVHVMFDMPAGSHLANKKEMLAKLRRIKFVSVANNTYSTIVEAHNHHSRFVNVVQDMKRLGYKYACFWGDGVVCIDSDIEDAIIKFATSNDSWKIAGDNTSVFLINLNNCDLKIHSHRSIRHAIEMPLPDNILSMYADFKIYDDMEHTESWLLDNSNEFKVPTKKLDSHKSELYGLKYMGMSQVYLTNTEPYPQFNPNEDFVNDDIDTFILPCAGIGQFLYILQHMESVKHVVFFDVNPHSVEWLKYLVSNWNGIENPLVIMQQFENDYVSKHSHVRVIKDEQVANEFMHKTTEAERVSIMDKLNSIHIDYLVADLCRDSSIVIDAVHSDSVAYINYTNIVQYESNYLNSDIIDVDAEFYKTMSSLNKKCKRVYFKGDTPSGIDIGCVNIAGLKGL